MKKILFALFLFLIDGISMFLFHRYPDLFFPYYRDFSKGWIAFLSSLSSGLPFAIWDISALFLLLAAIISLLHVLLKRKSFLKWLSNVFLTVSILCFAAVMGWMLNHYGPDLREELSMETRTYTVEELYEACDYYLLQAKEYALMMSRDEQGHLLPMDFDDLAVQCGSAYLSLSEEYPIFKGSTARVKKLSLVGEYLMYNGIIGMFMPITGEAGIPEHVPDAVKAFTMAHEAGHRLGLAGEEEANYAAFLACIHNEDIHLIYSGYYSAFSYCFSSLYRNDSEMAMELYEKYDDPGIELLKLDRKDTSKIHRNYESKLQDISDQINDTYLKTFSQQDGILSYGKVTEYLIAYYFSTNN